jgi:tRNA threonylcarbamoyladenosine biosynthesis protein TsaE
MRRAGDSPKAGEIRGCACRSRAIRARLGQQTGRLLPTVGPGPYNHRVTIAVELPDVAATGALAARVAELARPRDVIALRGELGAGKTVFARAFIHASGSGDEVPSPSFTLVNLYHAGRAMIWHFDLYRLQSPEETWELGIEDAFSDGISLIEWPERLGRLLPARRLEIALYFTDRPEARRAELSGGSEWQARLARIAADA